MLFGYTHRVRSQPEPLGFIVGRHNILCCALVLRLISVGFLPDNQANLKTLPNLLSP
jgi:hypothetical protein